MALSADDRSFFALVSEAAFSNPFGDERLHLDARITGLDAHHPDIVERLVTRVSDRLDALRPVALHALPHDDAQLVEDSILFETFHRFAADMDALIETQARSTSPIVVPFFPALQRALVGRGVAPSRAARALELFYQLRRAFSFITRALAGRGGAMRRLRESLWSNVFTQDVRRYERHLWNRMEDFSTILLGATGTGKGAAASAIGRSGFIPFEGDRFGESFTTTFVPINLSEFSSTLVESELFGHKKGAFTGAIDRHEGLFSRCSRHGAIFLDEIGELTTPIQVKLLRVLQEREFQPVGSHERRRFEGRVIAATHRSLSELRREGRFREDFYYRLCSDVIEVPTLAERLAESRDELDDLVSVIVEKIVGAESKSLTAEVRDVIERDVPRAYGWPGNVRELEQTVRRVLLTGKCRREPIEPVANVHERLWLLADAGTLDAKQLLSGYCALLHRRTGTYEEVARITKLDRRTAKKHVLDGSLLLDRLTS